MREEEIEKRRGVVRDCAPLPSPSPMKLLLSLTIALSVSSLVVPQSSYLTSDFTTSLLNASSRSIIEDQEQEGSIIIMSNYCIYKDPNAPVEARVADLLSRMTLQEKVAQMMQVERSFVAPYLEHRLPIGSVFNYLDSPPPFEKESASAWVDMVDGYQELALGSRLSIPMMYAIDAIHGIGTDYVATIFPHNVGLGATRDEDLLRRIGVATAREARARGIHYVYAPCVAVGKDPRWLRCYESYSEDTNTVRSMTSIISGLQGQLPEDHPKGYPFVAGRNNVIACAKHFVGDGGTDAGKNEGNTELSYDELERIHIAPYLDSISQGVSTIMATFSSWNGRKVHADHFLLTEVLKEKLGFKGIVTSDWEGLDRLANPRGSNYRQSVVSGINAGIDMVMVGKKHKEFLEELVLLVESGEISMARIDDAVKRILRVKFVAGLFESPFADRSLLNVVGCKGHRDLAREAVRKSLVLLKNGREGRKPLLPLPKTAKRILVAGSHADNIDFQCGGWTMPREQGPNAVGTTILEAIKNTVGEETEIVYEKDPLPGTLASRDFSYAIVAVGEEPFYEFRDTNPKLEILFNGAELISLIADTIPTVVVLISGRPLVLEEEVLAKVDAFIAAWLPGIEAEGITDVIYGDYDFQGRLPVSWFKNLQQLPIDKENADSYDPLFPFGFGLNYNNPRSSSY